MHLLKKNFYKEQRNINIPSSFRFMLQGNPLLDWFKNETSFLITPLAKFLQRLGIHPHVMTSLSFIAGCLSAFFLFSNHFLVVVFGIAHFFFDGLDGALARVSRLESVFGSWFDYATDRTVTFFFLLQIYFFYLDPWILGILFLYFLHHLIYIATKGTIIVFYSRTILLLSALLGFYWFGIFF